MGLAELLTSVTADLYRSLNAFKPELTLIATIVLLLFFRLFQRRGGPGAKRLALLGVFMAVVFSIAQLQEPLQINVAQLLGVDASKKLSELPADEQYLRVVSDVLETLYRRAPVEFPFEIFGGMLRFDSFTLFFRLFLLLFTALVVWLTMLTGIPDQEDAPDFYVQLLGATLGMSLMVSANHLLMVYMAVEMASLPSYALAGFLKGRRQASEASLKYVVFGAGASGIMLYGISLLAGRFGTAHLPTLGYEMALSAVHSTSLEPILVLGLMLIVVGIAFKIAAVPFHFWCPDVFEGASAEVAGFLSVASKAAALGLLTRIAIALVIRPGLSEDSMPLDRVLGASVGLLAAITATYGNLAAYGQTNLKRLLAFSTIAHAGYMMMPVAAALFLTSRPGTSDSTAAFESMIFYLVVYLFMNLGAFGTVALIRNRIRSEDLKDYSGLVRRCPFLTVAMAVFLLSLTGIPPLAGFVAKFCIFAVLYESGMYALLAIGLANTVVSLFYYVKVLRVMIIDPPTDEAPARPASDAVLFQSLLIVVNLALMMPYAWNYLQWFTKLSVLDLLR